MKSTSIIAIIAIASLFIACREEKKENSDVVIGPGKMPNLARDLAGNFYVVYGTGIVSCTPRQMTRVKLFLHRK